MFACLGCNLRPRCPLAARSAHSKGAHPILGKVRLDDEKQRQMDDPPEHGRIIKIGCQMAAEGKFFEIVKKSFTVGVDLKVIWEMTD